MDPGPIIVAAVAATPGLLAALGAWRSNRNTAAHVGQSNGRGTVADMQKATLESLERLEYRFDRLDARVDRIDIRLTRVEDAAVQGERPLRDAKEIVALYGSTFDRVERRDD